MEFRRIGRDELWYRREEDSLWVNLALGVELAKDLDSDEITLYVRDGKSYRLEVDGAEIAIPYDMKKPAVPSKLFDRTHNKDTYTPIDIISSARIKGYSREKLTKTFLDILENPEKYAVGFRVTYMGSKITLDSLQDYVGRELEVASRGGRYRLVLKDQ